MATTQIGTLFDVTTGYQRDEHGLDWSKNLFDALRCFSFAQQYHPMDIAVFEKNFSSLGGGARSTENKNFRDALLFFRDHFYTKLLPGIDGAQTELERFSPLDVVERVGEAATEETKLRRADRHEFAGRLVSNFKERLKLQLNKSEENALVEGVEGSLSKAAALASSTQELHNRAEEELSELLLSHPDTQRKFINDQHTAKIIAHEELEAGKQPPFQQILFSDPVNTTKAVIHALSPEVPDKELFFRIAAALPIKHDESVDGFLTGVGQTTRAAVAATVELPTTGVSARAGAILPLLVQTGARKLVAPVFAVLPQKIKDAFAVASVGRAWESAVEKITKSMGGVLTPGLTQVIQQGSQYLGKTSGGPSFFGAVTDVFSPLLIGPIEPALYNYLQAHRVNDLLPKNQKFFGDTTALSTALSTNQSQDGRGAVYLLFTVVVSGGQRDAHLKQDGSGSAWVVDFGGRLLGTLATKKAGGGATGGFFSKLFGFFGVRLGGQALAGATGGIAGKAATGGLIRLFGFFAGLFSGGWAWAISIAGGIFGAPLFNKVFNKAKKWLGNILSGGITNAKVARDAITSLVGAGGTAGSAQKEQQKSDVFLALFLGVIIFILFFVYLFQAAKQNTDLFVASQEIRAGGPYDEVFPQYGGPFPGGPTAIASCAVDYKHLTQTPFDSGGIKTHINTCAYDFDAPPYTTQVKATHNGCVAAVTTSIKNNLRIKGSYGNYVLLAGTGLDGKPFYSLYAHLAQNTSSRLSVGDCVGAGYVLGSVDSTGYSTGPHLHLEFLGENQGKITETQCSSSFALPAGCTQ